MRVFTIGFTKKPASRFFRLLQESGARRVVDVRLNNSSQLAGFAKRDDLRFFLAELCSMDYVHLPALAPTKQLLSDYRKRRCSWSDYESRFFDLMRERRVERTMSKDMLSDACLLCSEHRPVKCHRRLVVEYLDEHWGGLDITHLGHSEEHRRSPSHPGRLLADECDRRGLDSRQAAVRLGVDRVELVRVTGKQAPLTPELAVRLEDANWGSAEFWMRLQSEHGLAQARRRAAV